MRTRVMLLAVLLLLLVAGLLAYDRTGSCDVGPVTRAIEAALGQDRVIRCAG